jgi:hypothetical protein
MTIFEDIASVIVDYGTDEVNCGVRGWRDRFEEDALSRECLPATK